jgi:hypothetical protein
MNRPTILGRRPLIVHATVVLVPLAVILVTGTTVQVALIGHSGAKAAWHGVASASHH